MAIASLDNYYASIKQVAGYFKIASRTSVAAKEFSLIDLAGSPGAGTLAGSNTANGVVPTDAIAGYPVVNDIQGGNEGILSRVAFSSSVAGRLVLYDRLFLAGAYSFNSNVTLTSQPSYAARVPNADYKNLELWVETVTAFTGNMSIQVTYQDQDNNAGDTGTIATGIAPTVGRLLRLALAAGDSGIMRVNSVIATVATVGTFNVMVLRKLWEGRVKTANDGDVHDLFRVGMPLIYSDSALYVVAIPDSTSTGLPALDLEIAQG